MKYLSAFLIFVYLLGSIGNPLYAEEEPKESDIEFCVYHFKESINIYVNNLDKLINEGYKFNLSHHGSEDTEYPIYVTIEAYKPEGPSVTRHILTFVPIKTDKFSQGIIEDKGLLEFKFIKEPVSEEKIEEHLEAIHEFTYTVPHDEYTLYLVPGVLEQNDEGEFVFEFKPAQNLKTIPKMLVPKNK